MNKNWHVKIAKNRGKKWHENMLKGRREAVLNPSVIRLVRIEKKLEQTTVAGRIKMTPSTYGAVERGRRPVKEDVATQIASLFGTPLKKLFKPLGNKKFIAIIQRRAV